MIICPTCQTLNRAEARFCLSCGARLAVEPPTSADPAPVLPAVGEVAPESAAEVRVEAVNTGSSPNPDQESQQPATDLSAETPEPAGQADDSSQEEPAEPDGVTPDATTPDAVTAAPLEPSIGEPLAAGAVIGERFTVTALLEDGPDGRIYTAFDPTVCTQCGAALELGDKYCGACGVELTGPALVRLQETAEAPAADAVEMGGRWYVVLPPDVQTPSTGPAQGGWRLQVGQASDAGKVRDLDEDSIFSLVLSGIYESQIETTVGLFVVADGIGGQEGGEVASKLGVQTIAQQVLQRIIWPILQGETLLIETLEEELRQAVQVANRQVYDLRRERGNDMGTTLTMALLINGLAIIGNVGDSRTYVWGPDGLAQLTTDHSLIAALIAAGQEPPEAIYTHPQRNLITRSLGDNPYVEVDLSSLELEPGFKLILCCDGVWEMIRDEGIEDVMLQEEHPQQAADKIVAWSNNAGGEDNISVVVVAVEQA